MMERKSRGWTLMDGMIVDLGEQLDAVAKVSENDLNRLAYEAVPVEKTLLLLVGDKDEIIKQTKELGLPTPVELTTTGDPVN